MLYGEADALDCSKRVKGLGDVVDFKHRGTGRDGCRYDQATRHAHLPPMPPVTGLSKSRLRLTLALVSPRCNRFHNEKQPRCRATAKGIADRPCIAPRLRPCHIRYAWSPGVRENEAAGKRIDYTLAIP